MILPRRGYHDRSPHTTTSAPCSKVSNWISSGVQRGYWQDVSESNYMFDLGYLDEMVVTQNCALCRLVTAAISQSFSEFPLVYSWVGNWGLEKTINGHNIKKEYSYNPGAEPKFWREQVSISVLGLQAVYDFGMQIGLSLSLKGRGGPEFDLDDSRTLFPGMTFLPSIRVLEPDVHMVPSKASRNRSGRQINPAQADLRGIQECYKTCRELHGQFCETHRNLTGDTTKNANSKNIVRVPAPKNMLVIDAKHMRIVPLPGGARYVALSYVWGTKPFVQLKKSNADLLKRKGALQQQQLPRTVEDAISLTLMLNERYLWVDALCIVQDDMTSKLEQLIQMDIIYLGAALTVINGDGKEAAAGLTGFRPDSRHSKQVIESIGGIRFAVMSPPLQEVLKFLPWHTRAWTYQEYMLSKRILVFTNQQVYYLCGGHSFAEDHYRPPYLSTYESKSHTRYTAGDILAETKDVDARHVIDRVFRYPQNWHAYRTIIADHSARQMTYESDVLKSIIGVLQQMKSSRAERYICGLPSSMLEWGLLWQPAGTMKRRGDSSQDTSFPSWSWVGWVGPVKYIDEAGPEGAQALIKDWQLLTYESAIPAKPKSSGLKGLLKSRSSEPPPTQSTAQPNLLPYQPVVNSVDPIWQPTNWVSWKNAQNTSQPGQSKYNERVHLHQAAMDKAEPLIESGLLQFTAASAFFTVQAGPLPNGYKDFPPSSTGSFRIIDQHGTWVGTVHLDVRFGASFGPSCEAEFIALSITHYSYEATDHVDVGKNTFDVTQLRELDLPARTPLILNVMWIQRQDGTARRVAVGQIHVHAWDRAGPKKQQVLLG